MKKIVLAAVVATGLAGGTAFAHSGATGVVKERMDAMMSMGKSMKAVAAMMRGEVAYDADAVREAAALIKQHSGDAMTELFPEGSTGHPSEAKPEIWSKWDEFSDLAGRLAVYADGLALAADNGMMADQGGMGSGGMMGAGSNMMGSDSGMMGSGSGMMGGDQMHGNLSAEDIGTMPVDGAFAMTSQVCSACHTRFRAEDK
ncbi:c-type cytochrome [Pacificispira sp.]|uniref:c-type cytochrome n=1 Tax=Pacificispira sp. TaxID=2888761 RepID=UPI003BAA8B64